MSETVGCCRRRAERGGAELERRLSDLKRRGVVLGESQSLADLFFHREPLYECYHDLKVETSGQSVDETVQAIQAKLSVNLC